MNLTEGYVTIGRVRIPRLLLTLIVSAVLWFYIVILILGSLAYTLDAIIRSLLQ